MSTNFSNVRILAKAYANQRIGRDMYVALRREQVNAIENGEEPPELPVEVQVERYSEDDTTPTEVALQTVEIAPHGFENKRQLPVLAIVSVIAALAIVFALDWFVFKDAPPTPPVSSENKVSLGIELSAHRLMEQRTWEDQDINALVSQWDAASPTDKESLRESLWFSRLNRVITKRIGEIEKLVELTGSSKHAEESMAQLKTLQGTLNNTQAPEPEATSQNPETPEEPTN